MGSNGRALWVLSMLMENQTKKPGPGPQWGQTTGGGGGGGAGEEWASVVIIMSGE